MNALIALVSLCFGTLIMIMVGDPKKNVPLPVTKRQIRASFLMSAHNIKPQQTTYRRKVRR
jgi:hypothetical protein